MVIFLGVLEFPEHFGGDMDSPTAKLKNRLDVGFERVAYHEKLGRIDTKFCAEIYVVLLTLIGSDFNVMERVIKS